MTHKYQYRSTGTVWAFHIVHSRYNGAVASTDERQVWPFTHYRSTCTVYAIPVVRSRYIGECAKYRWILPSPYKCWEIYHWSHQWFTSHGAYRNFLYNNTTSGRWYAPLSIYSRKTEAFNVSLEFSMTSCTQQIDTGGFEKERIWGAPPIFYQVEICDYDRISLLWEDFISQPNLTLARMVFSCPQQLNRWPCLSLGRSVTTNNQSLHNTTEWTHTSYLSRAPRALPV